MLRVWSGGDASGTRGALLSKPTSWDRTRGFLVRRGLGDARSLCNAKKVESDALDDRSSSSSTFVLPIGGSFASSVSVSSLTLDCGRGDEPLDAFGEIQAILSSLPTNAVSVRTSMFAKSCCAGSAWAEAALQRACLEYPRCAAELGSLVVVQATLDLVMFADHSRRRLLLAARGTDRRMRRAMLPRDLGNDALIAMGFKPARVKLLVSHYRQMCERYPQYDIFGAGHSLGATVIEWLAVWAERVLGRPFTRIDLFNPGSSPLRRKPVPLARTEVHTHRVAGDLVSRWHTPAGSEHVRARRPELGAHSLQQFLPSKDPVALEVHLLVEQASQRAAAAVALAQGVARAAVAELCSRASVNILQAQRNIAFAENVAAADARGEALPRRVLARHERSKLCAKQALQSKVSSVWLARYAGC